MFTFVCLRATILMVHSLPLGVKMSEDPPDSTMRLSCILTVSLFETGFTVVAAQHGPATVAVAGWIAGTLGALSSLALLYELYQRYPSPRKMTRLAKEACETVRRLVADGYTTLIPQGVDPETVYLKLAMNGDVAIIERHEHVRDAIRAYHIYANGKVRVRICGTRLLPQDHAWYHAPLTMRRLAYLHRVVHGKASYSPRRANSCSS